MQEQKVSQGDKTYDLPQPFFVLATQNPIEQEGTYPLPEAQLDRFTFSLYMRYPSFEDEVRIAMIEETFEKNMQQCMTIWKNSIDKPHFNRNTTFVIEK